MGKSRPIHVNGLIPAGAGNIPVLGLGGFRGRAHPRGCGEHGVCSVIWMSLMGSSPRVRGTFRNLGEFVPVLGLIPAGAGNMSCTSQQNQSCWAHPRGCGEHHDLRRRRNTRPGSSPRVRGTFPLGNLTRLIAGLIPAGAGNIL